MTKEIEQLEELVHKRTYRTGEVTQLRRIADALEEVLRLVKADQERSKKYMEEKKDEQASRASNGPSLPAALAMARGPRTKLQATSGKLQAPSFRVDKIKL